MVHYKVSLDDGSVMQFDSDRKLSAEEVQQTVDENHPKSPGFLQKSARFIAKEGLPLAGMVGGEALGAAGGALAAPLTGASSIPVGEVAGGGMGYAVGQEASNSLQELMGAKPKTPFLSKLKDLPKQAAIGAGYTLGGKMLGPFVKKGFPRVAEAVTGISGDDFAKHAGDLKATLPEKVGGSKTVEGARAFFRDMITKAGVDPAKMEFDAFATSGQKRQFIQEVEKDIKYPVEGAKVATHDLIKAYDAISDEIGKAYSSGEKKAARQLIERKTVIRGELFGRSDPIAQGYKTLSRAKMSENMSKVLPGGTGRSDYLIRRALIPALAYSNPKFLLGMSPRIWSAAQALGQIPSSVTLGTAVDALRKRQDNP